jgi:type IV pilus assembly protein PilO
MAKSLHQLSPRAQTIVFVLLCGLTTVGSWQVLIGPEHAHLSTMRARLAAVQGDVARAAATAAKLPELQRQVHAYEVQLEQTTAVLPDEKDPEDVLRNLHEVASESQMALATFNPKPIVPKTQYQEWPISINLDGNYHDLGRFFARIASMSRLMSITDLQVKTQTKQNSRSSVTATCVATTFVFRKDFPPQTPATPNGAAPAAGGKQ